MAKSLKHNRNNSLCNSYLFYILKRKAHGKDRRHCTMLLIAAIQTITLILNKVLKPQRCFRTDILRCRCAVVTESSEVVCLRQFARKPLKTCVSTDIKNGAIA